MKHFFLKIIQFLLGMRQIKCDGKRNKMKSRDFLSRNLWNLFIRRANKTCIQMKNRDGNHFN